VLAQLETLHPENLRVVYRHFPLVSIHDKASLAGQAAEAAGSQGAFWEMHDLLFEKFDEWVRLSPKEFQTWLVNGAEDLGLDVEQFQYDLENETYASAMEQAYQTALSSGLTGTPMVFLNNQLLRINPELRFFEAAIRLTLLEDRQESEPPAMTIDLEKEYLATLHFDIGNVEVLLSPLSAPQAVNNFLYLVEEGWFDNNPVQRVIPDVLVEMGDPSGTGFGTPGYHLEMEFDPALAFDEPGIVAMTSSGPNTNSGQFFITLAPIPELDGARTIIGRVVKGLELLENLKARDPLEDLLDTPEAVLESISIGEP
jgi:cyclophilin family peptidyl-prolyl cis-trans isomerase